MAIGVKPSGVKEEGATDVAGSVSWLSELSSAEGTARTMGPRPVPESVVLFAGRAELSTSVAF